MDNARTANTRGQPPAGEGVRLDSWKKIAAHFNRDVTTVQRWERREHMPVHRHLHDKQGSVYAFRAELDAWWEDRRGKQPRSDDGASESAASLPGHALAEPPVPAQASPPAAVAKEAADSAIGFKASFRVVAFTAAALLLGYAMFRFVHAGAGRPNPLASATVTRLTDWPGIEQAAEISRDGKFAAFLADRDGHMDAWITEVGSGRYRSLTNSAGLQLVNPSIRTLGFSADGMLGTVWTRKSDGSHSEDIGLMATPTAGGALRDYLAGVAEAAWSDDGTQLAYHTTAPGDPLFLRDAHGVTRQIYAAQTGDHCHFPLWSKDGSFVYFVRGTPPAHWDIWRIRPSGADLERITSHDSHVSHPVWLDERTLLYLASGPDGSGPWLYALSIEERVPHRLSFGLEHYSSLSANASGTRLLATVDDSQSSIWSVPLQNPSQPVAIISAAALAPRTGPEFFVYVSERAGRQGVWKSAGGQRRELWSDSRAMIVGAPAVDQAGRQIAFTVNDGGHTILYAMDTEGRNLSVLTRSLDLRGNPSWAPDGRSIVSAVLRDGEPRVMSIYLDGSPARPLVAEYSIDPVWSPDGQYLLYSGADVGTTFPLRAVARDGRPYPIPTLLLTRGTRRIAFRPDTDSIVFLRGEMGHQNFFLMDLRTGSERQVTEFKAGVAINDFDISRDGSAVMFDRTQKTSHIALIERGG